MVGLWCLAVRPGAHLAILLVLNVEAKVIAPPTVEPGAVDFGGGWEMPGHGRWMQEVGHRKAVEVLDSIPDWETFYREYVRANRPVVLKNGAKNQEAFTKWTDEYLRQLWGKRRVIDVEIKKVEERGGPSVQWPFEKFLSEMHKVERQDELYAVIGFEDDPKALEDIAFPDPARCEEVWPQSVTLWMSNGGTMSVLHNDDGENFLMLLDGTKSVMLVHQDEAPNIYAHIAKVRGTSPVRQDFVDLVAFPRFANITWQHGEIEAGDILFIPHTFWHQVNSKGRNLAVNIWWSHEADWQWWDLKRYDATLFGTSQLPPFDKFKIKATPNAKCTPLPKGQSMAKSRMVDESRTKEIIKKRRTKAKRQKKAAKDAEL